ncbi:hypothetical protein KSP39_PZI012958 [Platanthera zijinensis]|uniref:Retrotransposon Copia-like N-terminal domain-containing protein n=1 Tax=Platanthera zijinensis TaxID=2320716 RepID=A0AAP0BCF8_9ASPA
MGSTTTSSLPARFDAPPTEVRDELRITTISLSGKANFVEWVHSVCRVLQTKGLLHHLTRAKPADPTDDWIRDDGRVQSWMLNSMDTETNRMSMYYKTVKEMWDEMHSLYSGKDNLEHMFDNLQHMIEA